MFRQVMEQSSARRTRNHTDDGHEAVVGSSRDRTMEPNTSSNEVATEQVVDESKPLVVEVKGHFLNPCVCIWDRNVGLAEQLLQPGKFLFTHCRIWSEDDLHEWITLDSFTISGHGHHLASGITEPPGYEFFKKLLECVFQGLVYARDSNEQWKNDLANTTYIHRLREEFTLSDWKLRMFSALREGFDSGMASGEGRVALHSLVELLLSFIHINETDHLLSVYNIGGRSALGRAKVQFYVEPNRIAKVIQTKKRKRISSGHSSSDSSGEYFLPVSSAGSRKSRNYNTRHTSSDSDYGAANEGGVQVSSGVRRDFHKYFVPDVVLKAKSIDNAKLLTELLTVSVKHEKIDPQAVRQLHCEILPLVLKHNVAMGLLINAREAYRIKLLKINDKIAQYEVKYDFVVINEINNDECFNVESFNLMCVHIINDCQKAYDAYLRLQ